MEYVLAVKITGSASYLFGKTYS